jgi:hypothetical protein
MATRNQHSDGIEEECSACGQTTPHEVTIDILTESGEEENAEFSREPYRVAVCQTCDSETATRMNNA